MEYTISVKKLKVHFPVEDLTIRAVDEVTTSFYQNEVTGIIGETGCGKSVLGMSLINLLSPEALVSGTVRMGDIDVFKLSKYRLRQYRNRMLSLIPQNPSTSLNPVMRAGRQIEEAYTAVEKKNDAGIRVRSALHSLGFSKPGETSRRYPFELSGGMKERILVALGLIRNPEWLLADEPTKGLDASLRTSVGSMFENIVRISSSGIILITHDIELADRLCDRIIVMYGGHIIEDGPKKSILRTPKHPYTRGLIASLPKNGFRTMQGPPIGIGSLPDGCRFHPRCPFREDYCFRNKPLLTEAAGRKVRCHLYT